MARIVSVYQGWQGRFSPRDMSFVRWLKIAEALARRGHHVDIATREPRFLYQSPIRMAKRLRRVRLESVRWREYDVVKTVFHAGFETLRRWGGENHPFIIAKLGSVVGGEDVPGVHFHGEIRARLFESQRRIRDHARYVTVLSPQAESLWHEWHDGDGPEVLLVPGGVDAMIPRRGRDPYRRHGRIAVLFAGNIYSPTAQPEAHQVMVTKLNELGRRLLPLGARLHFLGTGDTSRLDPEALHCHGSVPYDRSWRYLLHADVGIVVSAGTFMHNNESTKLYHYLRAGLPVVSESGFPNDHVVHDSGLGRLVENGDLERMARTIVEVAAAEWDRERAIEYVLRHHTWDRRCEVYDRILPPPERAA
jgi:glycosyltransferase involved in cell wall biosynthesis